MFRKEKDTPKASPNLHSNLLRHTGSYLTLTYGRSYLSQREYQATGCWVLFGGWGWSWGADNKGVDLCRLDFQKEGLEKAKLSQSKASKFGENQMTKSTEGR